MSEFGWDERMGLGLAMERMERELDDMGLIS